MGRLGKLPTIKAQPAPPTQLMDAFLEPARPMGNQLPIARDVVLPRLMSGENAE